MSCWYSVQCRADIFWGAVGVWRRSNARLSHISSDVRDDAGKAHILRKHNRRWGKIELCDVERLVDQVCRIKLVELDSLLSWERLLLFPH
jgi:hypothetical protein